jgi:short-subunit dehydrogenase involved in D-alanine esterification of teichoic acids
MIDAAKILMNDGKSIPLHVMTKAALASATASLKKRAKAQGFEAAPLTLMTIADAESSIE